MRAEPGDSLAVVADQRLFGKVAGRHDQRAPGFCEQQVMQRRVGQHHADHRIARGEIRRQPRILASRDQDDGPFDRGQQLALGIGETGGCFGVGQGTDHDGERFLIASFAAAQFGDRLFIGGIARQVKAAQALDCGQPSRAKVVGGGEPDPGTAARAGIGLRMKPPVRRIVVLRLAVRTHREHSHRRVDPVIRYVACDRESRPAVRAVGERIPITPVGGVLDVGEALRAGGQIGWDRHATVQRGRGLDDLETGHQAWGQSDAVDRTDAGGRRRGGLEAIQEGVERAHRSEGFDGDTRSVVADPAADTMRGGEAEHPGAEADALNNSPDFDSATFVRHGHRAELSQLEPL